MFKHLCCSFGVLDKRKIALFGFCVSFRSLCDNLRRERDRAVSDLADALRNLDDMRKQKNDTARELKELRQVIPPLLIFFYFFITLSDLHMNAL